MDSTEFRLRTELGAANARVEELERKLAAAELAGVLVQHAAALAEREACAKLAEEVRDRHEEVASPPGVVGTAIATRIRARK